MSGLTAAIRLGEVGIRATLFEKSRGSGGRLASKRLLSGSADIGAQYFTIRSADFREFLDQYAGRDSYREWGGRLRFQRADGKWDDYRAARRYVGVPRMAAVSRSLARGVDLHAQTRVDRIIKAQDGGWRLLDTQRTDLGIYDAVIVTTPPVQARDLLAASETDTDLQAPVFHAFPLQACWTVVAHFRDNPFPDADGLGAQHQVIQWAANNSSKPGRPDSDGEGAWWVLHARADWSEIHQNAGDDWVREQLLSGFAEVCDRPIRPDDVLVHRWLYAKTTETSQPPGYQWYPDKAIGLCGDWLSGGRVEGAFDSADGLIREMQLSGRLRPDWSVVSE